MLTQRLVELTRWGWEKRIIILDKDGLWERLGGNALSGREPYTTYIIHDEMKLRYLYEKICRSDDKQCLLVISNPMIGVPYDIGKRFYILDLNFGNLFPQLSSDALRGLPGLDLEQVAFALDQYVGPRMGHDAARHFCTETIYRREYAQPYSDVLQQRCLSFVEGALTYLDWGKIASWYGKAMMLSSAFGLSPAVSEQVGVLQTAFAEWMAEEYRKLSAEVNLEQPVLLSDVVDFLRRQSRKVALIVLDGMSFENLHTIQRHLLEIGINAESSGVFSFLPSVTTIARQCLFAGKLPVELPTLSTLTHEEKQWRSFWRNAGLREEEICFAKADTLEIDERWKAVGLVVNIIDDLMHSQLQGMDGMARDLNAWVKTGKLKTLLDDFDKAGFQVWLTSDHGNTSAIAQGRLKNPGVLGDPASKRAVIYQSFADAIELDKFNVNQYDGTYLPSGSNVWLFSPGACYGDSGKEYITHGGMTIEEVIVPFVRIGA